MGTHMYPNVDIHIFILAPSVVLNVTIHAQCIQVCYLRDHVPITELQHHMLSIEQRRHDQLLTLIYIHGKDNANVKPCVRVTRHNLHINTWVAHGLIKCSLLRKGQIRLRRY